MIAISIKKVQEVIKSLEGEIKVHVDQRLDKLKKFRDEQATNLNQSQIDYLSSVINDLPALVIATPSEIQQMKTTTLYQYELNSDTYLENNDKKKKKSFKHTLLYYLAYSNFRADFLPKYFQKIGIKACVFCNSQLTISTIVSEGIPRARFQVDHYHAKSKYPCFAISLFNFYPSCATCNLIKSNKELHFELYSNDQAALKKSNYLFKLKDGLLAEYLLSQKQEVLDIEFIEEAGKEGLQQTFDIEGIYATQKDIAEELIWKRQVYSSDYKSFLQNEFQVLYNDPDIANRLIVGNYIHEKDIHQRPMAKFMQDIARQIGLIE